MTKAEAVKIFVSETHSWSDYWSMQECWASFVDYLVRDGQVPYRRASNWANPTTPEHFKSWNKRHYN